MGNPIKDGVNGLVRRVRLLRGLWKAGSDDKLPSVRLPEPQKSPPAPAIELRIVSVDSPPSLVQPKIKMMSPPAPPSMIVNDLHNIIVEPRNEPQFGVPRIASTRNPMSTWDLEEGDYRGWGHESTAGSTSTSTSTSSLGRRSTRPSRESIRSAPPGEDDPLTAKGVKAGGKIIAAYRSHELGKNLLGVCITVTSGVALIYYHQQSQTTVVILILITCGCLGTVTLFLGLVFTDAFPRTANILDLLGIIFFFGAFFGGISSIFPPEGVWIPLVCWLAVSVVFAYSFCF